VNCIIQSYKPFQAKDFTNNQGSSFTWPAACEMPITRKRSAPVSAHSSKIVAAGN